MHSQGRSSDFQIALVNCSHLAPQSTVPKDTHLLSMAAMVSTRGTFRVSVKKQATAIPAKTEVAPKDTGGRMGLISPSVVTRGAAKPPRRALTEAKPIPICLWEVQIYQSWVWALKESDPVGAREESGALPGRPAHTHLISVG